MTKKTLLSLEYDKMLAIASAFCVSEKAREEFFHITPKTSYRDAVNDLELTSEALELCYDGADPIRNFDCIDEVVERAKIGACLSIPQLQKVLLLLKAASVLKNSVRDSSSFKTPRIRKLTENLNLCTELYNELDRSILNENELSDNASTALAKIRDRIVFQKNRLKQKLGSLIKSADNAKILQDSLYTIRNDRYVLPVKAEYKGSIEGLLHDASQTGSTLFIEPVEVLTENNALRKAIIEEQEEIKRILEEFTSKVASVWEELDNNQSILVMLDIVFAKAHYSSSIKGHKAQITEDDGFYFPKARHPLIDAKRVVAVDLTLGDKDILLISGPNTGGKTVALKTAGLLCLMAFSGFYLPTDEECKARYFSKVFCDIGDEQSIIGNLSTFSSHITNIVSILNQADKHTLVLLDELGAGTDPSEGAALGIAILKKLLKQGARAVATTHYSELKEFGLMNERVLNASMEFDKETFLPTFRLKIGLPGVSNAIAVSRHLGMHSDVIDEALEFLGEGRRSFEEVLILADRARVEAENEKQRLNKALRDAEIRLDEIEQARKDIDQEYQKIRNSARQKTEKIIDRAKDEAERILEQMRALELEKNVESLLDAKKLYSSLDALDDDEVEAYEVEFVPLLAEEAVAGRAVIVKSLGVQGIIKSPPNQKGEVDLIVGNMPVRLKLAELSKERFERKKDKKQNQKAKITFGAVANSENTSCIELKLLGNTVMEAEHKIDEFLDKAIVGGLNTVKIIHGMGTGALRTGIHRHLKKHRAVKEFRLGQYGEGGAGVTLVTVKT